MSQQSNQSNDSDSEPVGLGMDMLALAKRLYTVPRSLAGPGNRKTLEILSEVIPDLRVIEIPSGTAVGDWTVPPEWIVHEAWLKDPSGTKVADYSAHNLQLVAYSIPVDLQLDIEALQPHLHSLPDQPDAIPYVTSYYSRTWGFCLNHSQRQSLRQGTYTAYIDSELIDGAMSLGELVIRGDTDQEILISTYICHPQMANNELSGPVVGAHIARWVSQMERRRFTYRFVFVPETIGAVAYIQNNLEVLKRNVVGGYVLTCIGDDRAYSLLESRTGDTLADHVAKYVLKGLDPNYRHFEFLSRGSDERQYCSPAVDLPIASLMRSSYWDYPEYHTSLDDFSVVTSSGLSGGFELVKKCIEAIEVNRTYRSTTIGEPQLGKYGLYPSISKKGSVDGTVRLYLDIAAYCDGQSSLLDLAELLRCPIQTVFEAATQLTHVGVLEEVG